MEQRPLPPETPARSASHELPAMTFIHTLRDDLVDRLEPISLDALNGASAMLERRDHKYVVPSAIVAAAGPDLANHFDVLEIDGRRAFTYETVYFDDAQRNSYFDHHQGRRQRMKVRIRRYVESQLCFVEIKLKSRRGVTVKKRLPHDPARYGELDDTALDYIRQCHENAYGRPFDESLSPTIEMRYRRVTLAARRGGERLTIDGDLEFIGRSRRAGMDGRLCIIETKSAQGNGIGDRILRAHGHRPTRGCSKYCVGMAALEEVDRHNRFLQALRRIGVVRDAWQAGPGPAAAALPA